MDAVLGIPGINEAQLRAVNMCQIYLIVIMVSDMASTQGTAISLGIMLGKWRRESTLLWSNLPCTPPKMWEVFRRMIMKEIGTMARAYNPGAEMPLKKNMGKCLRVERHIQYALMRDEVACYERVGNRWRRYEKDTQNNLFRLQDEHTIDIT